MLIMPKYNITRTTKKIAVIVSMVLHMDNRPIYQFRLIDLQKKTFEITFHQNFQ